MKLDVREKIQPIHRSKKEQQGTLRRLHHSHSRTKHNSVHEPNSIPYIELLAIRSTRPQKHQSRQGAVSFSYRRWFDSPIGMTLRQALTDRHFQRTPERPDTEQLFQIKKLKQQETQEEWRKEQAPPTTSNFRRTFKCLKSRVRERKKQVVPQPLHISEMGQGQFSQRDLLTCNKIVPWKQHIRLLNISNTPTSFT